MQVIAFEPQPESVKEIRLRYKPYKSTLSIAQKVLGSNVGSANLYISPVSNKSSLDSSWISVSKQSTLNVEMTTLDKAISLYGKPHYCKLDVEGYELYVLKGLTCSIPLISFEYHLWRQEEIDKSISGVIYIVNFPKQIDNIYNTCRKS